MDSGLGVRWPLSPYATALAAGALFAFCIALWKHHSSANKSVVKDPSGQKFGNELESEKENDVCEKPVKEKDRDKRTKNYPLIAFKDFRAGFNYENLHLSGHFGAIPRIPQRSEALQNPHLSTCLRKRNVRKENNWQEFNRTSSNFSCIYQQSFCFGNEVPRLNAKFLLNVSPHIHSYLTQFCHLRDIHFPEITRKPDFENFDVSINPDILKNKPITRSAICLTLERQLHKFLKEPFREIKFNERAIQTAAILEEEEKNARSIVGTPKERDSKFDSQNNVENVLKPDYDDQQRTIVIDSSLWDSGYGDKTFDEHCSTSKKQNEDEDLELITAYKNITGPKCRSFKDSDIRDDSKSSNQANGNFDIDSTRNFAISSDINRGYPDIFSELVKEHTDELNASPDVSNELNTNEKKIGNNDSNTNTSHIDTEQNLVISHEKEVNVADENIAKDILNHNFNIREENKSIIFFSTEKNGISETEQSRDKSSFQYSNLEEFQETVASLSEERLRSSDENLSEDSENILSKEKIFDSLTRTSGVDVGVAGLDKPKKCLTMNLANSDLESIQKTFDSGEQQNTIIALSAALEVEPSEKRNSRMTKTAVPAYDVIEGGSSRDLAVFDEKGTSNVPRQMDRETGERSVAVESTVTTETTFRANGDARLSTAVVSRLSVDNWESGPYDKDDSSVSVKTTVSEEVFRPTFEEFVPLKSNEKISKTGVCKDDSFDELLTNGTKNGNETKLLELSKDELPSSPRVDRLKGLLSRDEERRSRTKFQHLADSSHVGGAMEGEWDRLLRDVLASVSELERWERRHCDVSTDAEDAEQQQHLSQSDSSFTMEEEALSPKGETPTKVKNLRFKLDPDVFDVPSDDSFYDDEDDEVRRGWKRQPKYKAFSSLELSEEPVRLVSVHASVVPAGQKMVARPVGIDLRVRLTEERQSKRAHVSTSPSQAKRRSPVSDRGIGWCQELSPVTENVDWRETFTPVTPECKSVPNGILKTPSPKLEPSPTESPNPFKLENGVTTNGINPVTENKRAEKSKYNGIPWKSVERKPFLLPRKKFEPDPEAIERITGYKSALSKPPLPPPVSHKINSNIFVRSRAEQARKQYLDSKASLSAGKIDGTKKFQQFLNQAQNDRARIVTSVPDLIAIEQAVSEQWTKERASVSPRQSPGREDNPKTNGVTVSRGSTPDDKWASYVQSCRQHLGRRSQSMTYLETDIDIIPVLDEDDKCHSTSALDEPDEALPDPDDSDVDRSCEDLDDSGRAKSEHELRIERSLRSLPLPDWYRRSEKTKTGFLLGSSNKEKRGWAAAKSLASSTSSLASCGLRRPVTSLRSSRENIPWSRSAASPDGPTLSLALAKAFREPYLGWRARTPTSSGVSSSPRASPPSWGATTTDDEANGVSFDGEDAFGRTTSSEDDRKDRDEPLSLDDTGADAVTVSMDTNDPVKLPGGEDTCDDINNMSMDTCELFDASVVVPVDEDPSPQADTGDDIDNLSTDTTTEGRKLDPKLKRYSYSQSIYHSEREEEEQSRGDRKGKEEDREPSPSSPDHKVVWIESSFVGSRTTTSIVVLPEKKAPGSTQERPASR